MHGFNALIIAACEFICKEYIFGVIICDTEKPAVFPLLRFLTLDPFGNLDIQLIFLLCGDKILSLPILTP